ncbi:MAG: hypothetical protein HY913_15555 [Desulfomonile tiedjei]|nr:hypothetical protein [Desulfomonile tiedjei]
MRFIQRFLVAVSPLLFTLLFAWLVMEGHLNLGGGCKDIFVAIPLLVWSLAFLICYVVLWWRGRALGRSVAIASVVATGLVLVAWVGILGILFLWG